MAIQNGEIPRDDSAMLLSRSVRIHRRFAMPVSSSLTASRSTSDSACARASRWSRSFCRSPDRRAAITASAGRTTTIISTLFTSSRSGDTSPWAGIKSGCNTRKSTAPTRLVTASTVRNAISRQRRANAPKAKMTISGSSADVRIGPQMR